MRERERERERYRRFIERGMYTEKDVRWIQKIYSHRERD